MKAKKIRAIKIHDIEHEDIRVIKSGDNKSWKRLDRTDRSMIHEVVILQRVITCGKFIYEPIY